MLVFAEALSSRGAATVNSQGREPLETEAQNPKAPEGRQDGTGQCIVHSVKPETNDRRDPCDVFVSPLQGLTKGWWALCPRARALGY